MTVLTILQDRSYNNKEDRLLAFGGAEYETTTATQVSTDELDEIYNLRSVPEQYSVRDIYSSIGYSSWNELSGSQEEIDEIGKYFPDKLLFTGSDANEAKLKHLSTSMDLLNYNYLHFATNGLAEPDLPELSAIVLAQNDKDDSQEDGYLTVSEISELNLKADLVVLSACETGVGKVYTGDGIVGLNQAFMIAGANGLVVSLWPVDDKSTSIFMNRFYYNISRDMPYHTAISETKRAFIDGIYGKVYKDPYYWAPFVYYGK